MTIKGPELLVKVQLEKKEAEKKLLELRATAENVARGMVGATKQQKAAAQDLLRVNRAEIASTKEHFNALNRHERALRRDTAARRESTAATEKATHSFGTFSKALGTSITLWYTARTAIYAVRNAIENVIGIYKKGVDAVDDFRLSVIATSAIMIPSIESGTTAAEKMAIAWEFNTKMLKDLEIVAAKHISTGKSLQQVYEGMIIAQVFPNEKDVENLARLADFITIYTKGQRLEIQLMQEVRGLMDGQVRAQNKLAYTLDKIIPGGLKKNIELWKAQGRNSKGELVVVEMIQKYLGNIAVLQGEILGTAQTWTNTLQTFATRILRDGVESAYKDIVAVLAHASKLLFDINSGYTYQADILSLIVKEGWERIKDAVRGFIGIEMKDLDDVVTELITDTLTWLKEGKEKAEEFGKSLKVAFEGALFIVKNIYTVILAFFALRVPAWILAIIEVAKAAIVVAEITPAIVAGWVGIAAAALTVLYRVDTTRNFLNEAAKSVENMHTNLSDMGDVMEKGVIAKSKVLADMWRNYEDVMGPFGLYEEEEKPTEPPKFSVAGTSYDPKEMARYEKSMARWIEKVQREATDIWLFQVRMRMRKEREITQVSEEEWNLKWQARIDNAKYRIKQEDDLVLKSIRDRMRLEENVTAISKETWEEMMELRIATYKEDLTKYGGHYLSILKLKEDIADEELAIDKARTDSQFELEKEHMKRRESLEKSLSRTKRDLYIQTAQIAVSSGAEALRMIAEHNKKWFKWYQAFAVAEIAINTAIAIMRAYAELGPIGGSIAAAFLGALGAVQAAAVLAEEPPEELAKGGVSESGFSAAAGVYGKPTYVMAERQGKPEAVVPLDKYVVSDKDSGGGVVNNNYYIMAMDTMSFRDFAKRNPGVFREQFTKAIEGNDPRMRSAIKTAAR